MEMTTEIVTEMETETTTRMPLPDQDPMVLSFILSQCLSIAYEYWATAARTIRSWHTIYLPFERCPINCCMQNFAFWTGVIVT